jgi:7,8-dihydropterin-6-yl-methyl-4-(beta-D-ribofuranosyl)aminobenzene 5'-phosphate synthase
MKTSRILSVIILFVSVSAQLFGQDYKYLDNKAGLSEITASNGIDKPVTVKIIYDNYVHENGLKSDWGYSIIIKGLEKGILFDAGTRPDIFEFNFKKMDLDADKVDLIVLSHEHGDHTEGLPAFTEMKKDIPVLIPFSFSDGFKEKMVTSGLTPVLVREASKICDNLYTSGEFAYQIPEQALVLNTKNGLVVMTGCSHPGIVEMLKEIKSTFNKNIYMVFGGFHLLDKSEQEMNSIISELKNIGIVKCGATHCTGEKQIKLIKDAFGANFVELGAGNSIVIN